MANVTKVADFLVGDEAARLAGTPDPQETAQLLREMAPYLPALAYEILPGVSSPTAASVMVPCF